jgi:hypothetical protein
VIGARAGAKKGEPGGGFLLRGGRGKAVPDPGIGANAGRGKVWIPGALVGSLDRVEKANVMAPGQ